MNSDFPQLVVWSETKYVTFSFLHIVDSGPCNIVPTLLEAQLGVKAQQGEPRAWWRGKERLQQSWSAYSKAGAFVFL